MIKTTTEIGDGTETMARSRRQTNPQVVTADCAGED